MPEQPPTLRDMIQHALDSGITYRELGERAIDASTATTLAKDTFNRIILGRVKQIPTANQLRAIAAALRAPYESVRQAAVNQWYPADDIPVELEREAQIAELKRLRDQADAALEKLEGPRRAG